jgi:hypothetical protein
MILVRQFMRPIDRYNVGGHNLGFLSLFPINIFIYSPSENLDAPIAFRSRAYACEGNRNYLIKKIFYLLRRNMLFIET